MGVESQECSLKRPPSTPPKTSTDLPLLKIALHNHASLTTTTQPPKSTSNPQSHSPPPQLHLSPFDIGKPLGKGKFGRVYLARHRPSGFICALKVLYKSEITLEEAETHVRWEIEVHSRLQHPGILRFYNHFHDTQRIFFVLEFAKGGEVFDALQRARRFDERRAARYVAQVAGALRYRHARKIMHRDIKPENILIGLDGELKLADFRYSVRSSGNRRYTMCGTLDYMPPEMLHLGNPHTRGVDLWSLGVLAYEYLTGEAPFEDERARTTRRILRRDMKPLPESVSGEAKAFVDALLVLEPTKRLTLDEVLAHPWILKHARG